MIWPKDTTEAKMAFYGDFREPHWQELNLTHIMPPFVMYYAKVKLTHGIMVHRKIVAPMLAVLGEIWLSCDRDQKKVDSTGASDYAGCFNIRRIQGSNNWSNHSWACAIDLSPGTNGFNMKPTIGNVVIAAFKRQGARWGGDYVGRKDPMHFEFVTPKGVT